MESLFVGLILAGVSGITFIAYRHPDLYKKEFSPYLAYAALGIIIASLIYDAGITAGHENLLPLLSKENLENIQLALKAPKVSQTIYMVAIASFFYNAFLSWLADHMKAENQSTKDN